MGFLSFFKSFDRSNTTAEIPTLIADSDSFDFSKKLDPCRGHFDNCRQGVIGGWAHYLNDIHKPVRVAIFIDGVVIATTLAEHERKDLMAKPIGNGRCAFRYEVPEAYCDGKEHTIHVRYADSGLELRNSPQKHILEPKVSSPAKTANPDIGSIEGEDGWYFLVNDTNHSLDQYRGLVRFSNTELEQYRGVFAKRAQYFSQKKIPYLFAIIPSKESIYREFLPKGISRSEEPLPADQLLAIGNEIAGLEMIDLRPAILGHKRKAQLYYKFDTHWTSEGAFFAYVAIIDQLSRYFPALEPMAFEDMNKKEINRDVSDLVSKTQYEFKDGQYVRAAVQKPLHSEPSTQLFPKGGFKARCITTPAHLKVSSTRETVIYERPDAPHLPTAVVFRDSFGDWIIPFLSEHFRRVVYIWQTPLNKAVIEAEKPDVVIHLTVDYFLLRIPKE